MEEEEAALVMPWQQRSHLLPIEALAPLGAVSGVPKGEWQNPVAARAQQAALAGEVEEPVQLHQGLPPVRSLPGRVVATGGSAQADASVSQPWRASPQWAAEPGYSPYMAGLAPNGADLPQQDDNAGGSGSFRQSGARDAGSGEAAWPAAGTSGSSSSNLGLRPEPFGYPGSPYGVPDGGGEDDMELVNEPLFGVREVLVAAPERSDATVLSELIAESVAANRRDGSPVFVNGVDQGVAQGLVLHGGSYRDVPNVDPDRIDQLIVLVPQGLDSTYGACRLLDFLRSRKSPLAEGAVVTKEVASASAQLLDRQLSVGASGIIYFEAGTLPKSGEQPPRLTPTRAPAALQLAAVAVAGRHSSICLSGIGATV